MLLGNVGVYPIKSFMLWMWGYNCLLNVLELKFLCCTTICVDCGMLYYYLRRLWNVVLLLFVVFFLVSLKLCPVVWKWKSFY